MAQDLRKELIQMIIQKSYEKRNVVLASGRISDFYIDMKNTLLDPKGIDLVSRLMLEKLAPLEGQLKGVGGPTMGADPLVTSLTMQSLQWKKPLMGFYIRKEPKAHGTSQWIEGLKNFEKDSRVFILEDVVTSGGSSLKAVEKAQLAGLKVEGIMTCIDREEGGREKIESAGLRFVTIATKSDILSSV
ncbi:MAG: orotate phosphoribosyltransferase [Bdellovibrionales bacterium]